MKCRVHARLLHQEMRKTDYKMIQHQTMVKNRANSYQEVCKLHARSPSQAARKYSAQSLDGSNGGWHALSVEILVALKRQRFRETVDQVGSYASCSMIASNEARVRLNCSSKGSASSCCSFACPRLAAFTPSTCPGYVIKLSVMVTPHGPHTSLLVDSCDRNGAQGGHL
eukprot:365940-Chlamydomonas_euryale.AAC.26